MKTKKISIVVLSALAAILFALAGIFAIGAKTNGKASAEDAPVITLGSGKWASPDYTLTTNGTTWTGTLANGGYYYGNIYPVSNGSFETAVKIYFTPIADNAAAANFRFHLADYSGAAEVKQFVIKKTEPFTRADVSCYFDKNYLVSFSSWNAEPKIVELTTVTLGTGRWATDSSKTVSLNNSTWSGALLSGYHYGNLYSRDGLLYSGAYIDKNANATNTESNIIFNLGKVTGGDEISEFVVKANTLFAKGDNSSALCVDKDYFIKYGKWESAPAVMPLADVVSVTLGEGKGTDLETKRISFNNSVWSGVLANGGYYYGNIYALDGTKFEAVSSSALPVYIIPGASNAAANIVIDLSNVQNASDITEFVLKKSEAFTRAGVPFYFDQDYVITCNWGGVPNVSCNFTMNTGAAIRLGEVNGLRFSANVAKSVVEGYRNAGYTVSAGMVILPYDYIEKYGDFSATNVFGEAYKGVRIIDLAAELIEEDEETYRINGSIVEIKDENLQRAFVGRAYLKLEKGGGVTYIMSAYADFNIANNSRTVMDIAQAAYDDSGTSEENKTALQTLYLSKKK
ncbi:MAG: hypothetical protein SPH68_08075 [Candidatus Borkfalkiaceae bacterium]|nr:hypothetical protein [Clostridia bacterium]MDY6224095.1 hypothetical protein [Christensenellaceae bacterium]